MNTIKLFLTKLVFSLFFTFFVVGLYAQQAPNYTQYMYNTMSVNPAYAGSKGYATIVALARTQWLGFEGAPDTQSLSFDTPIGFRGVGAGVSIINDQLGPSHEIYLDANASYTIQTGDEGNLAFGLKLGGKLLSLDWTKGQSAPNDPNFTLDKNIDNKFMPTIGTGIYYYEPQWYVGVSVPNFLETEHYDRELEDKYEVSVDRMHFYLIAGYVFDLTEQIKFKPAALFKGVLGAPPSIDVSANFLFNERFRAGLAWRFGNDISALLGFQINDSFDIGYAYDLTTSDYIVTNSGTHEILLRYNFAREERVRSPRFF